MEGHQYLRLIVLFLGIALVGCQSVSKPGFGSFKPSLVGSFNGYKVVEDPTGLAPGKLVERFEVRNGDCGANSGWSDCDNDRERAELSGPKDNYAGSEYWYGWSLFVPSDHPNVWPTKTALGQFHQTGSRRPAFMFQNHHGGYWVDRNFGASDPFVEVISKEDFLGKWNKIEVHARWHNSEGFFVVYVNGEEKYRFNGKTIDGSSTYFKYGVYRSFMSRYKNSEQVDEVPTQIAYFANVSRAKTRGGLLP